MGLSTLALTVWILTIVNSWHGSCMVILAGPGGPVRHNGLLRPNTVMRGSGAVIGENDRLSVVQKEY